MAKRKTPKADKIIDLKPKAGKITDEQLNRLQSTIKTVEHLTNDIGRLEIQKSLIMNSMKPHQEQIDVLRKEFSEEYGTDEINIQDGTINYPSENGETNKKN